MPHYPLNHHLRQTYRFLAGLAGLHLAVTGLIALSTTWGDPLDSTGAWVLGLRLNPAAAWLHTILGLVLLAAVLIGGNLYHQVALALGWLLGVLAILEMAVMQTDANVLHASMANVIVTVILALVVLTAGLYGKVGTAPATRAEETAQHPR
jgi:hypothetical protein